MFIYLLLIGITQAAYPNANLSIGPLSQNVVDDEDLDQIVYVNYEVMDVFNYNSFPKLSCCPNNVTKFRVMNLESNGSDQQIFILPFYIENLGDNVLQISEISITEEMEDQDIEVIVNYNTSAQIQKGFTNYLTLNFTHYCYKELNNDRYWSLKKVSLTLNDYDPIEFNYQFLCGKDYYPVRFDWSNIILIVFESVMILILSIFGKIYAFKIVFITHELKKKIDKEALEKLAIESKPFQGFSLSWPQALVYMALLIGALFISIYLQESAEKPIIIIVYIFCCFCTYHFINELFSAFRKIIPFFVKPIWYIRYCDIFSLIIGGALIALYLVLDQIWILSNLISICILGSMIKLFKIKSLKKSLLFFIPIMAIDIFCSIYLALEIRYEWDSLILRYFNTPLSPQIPYFRYIYKKKCAWVSVFNILFPGFFLGYVHRFDWLNKTKVYEIVSFFGLIIGLVLWVVVQYLTSFPLPTSIFTEVLMILICTFIAFWRNELKRFWSGDFYDEILYDPFKNEMDKKSVKVVSFFNIGVSKVQNKQVIQDSENPYPITQSEPFELVKAKQSGELELDSILFEGLYSLRELSDSQKISNNQKVNQMRKFYQSDEVQQYTNDQIKQQENSQQNNINQINTKEQQNGKVENIILNEIKPLLDPLRDESQNIKNIEQKKSDQINQDLNKLSNEKLQPHISPARLKYGGLVNQEQKLDRFEQKQQLRLQQNDQNQNNFKKNLEFFKNQEKLDNYKAPIVSPKQV